MNNQKYAIITSAYNEEKNIEKTIISVISQTVLPHIWIIISDGSIDATDDIVKPYIKKHKFIEFYRISREKKHSFNAKVNAINYGFFKLKERDYNFVGILDADVTFENNYYEKILNKFNENNKLGIAGGNVIEFVNGKYKERIKTFNSVAGAVQLFRRECYEDTFGFIPFECGGEDAAVEITARMKGWEVRTFPEIKVIHNGPVLSGSKRFLKYRFRRGIMFHDLGYHPLFHLVRCIYRIKERPFLIGTLSEIVGFIYASIKYKKAKLPIAVVRYLRKEQMQRLTNLFKANNVKYNS